MMETMEFKTDIKLFCMKAKKFPDGVLEAHQALHALAAPGAGRKYYGISRPEDGGGIIYRAAVTELYESELAKHNLETFVLKAGQYLCIRVKNFKRNITAIGEAFQGLIQNPAIDPEGACVEWYYNDTDVHCMVRMKN